MDKPIIQSFRDETGSIRNQFDMELFLEHMESHEVMPDLYLAFILKTIIDDFGGFLETSFKINKEQFEAQFMENLNCWLSVKTAADKQP